MSDKMLTPEDYAEEAQAAERGSAWMQAAALWRHAAEACGPNLYAARKLEYLKNAAACEHRAAVDGKLEEIAQKVLGVKTLQVRQSDRLDHYELSVGKIKLALRAAYEAGRASTK